MSARRRGPARPRLSLAGAALLALAAWALAGALVALIGLTDRLAPADVGVVLATELKRDGALTPRLQARCDRALEVWRQGRVRALLTSGGIDRHGFDEAARMKSWLVASGVPDSAVTADPGGVNTWHTAIDTRDWLAAHHRRTAFIVTQGFHVPRTRLAFARLGITTTGWAHARFFEPRDLYSIAREVPALVEYALRPLPPLTARVTLLE